MINNSAGSPSLARRSGSFGTADAGLAGILRVGTAGVPGAATVLREFSQCNPTATECAQIFPQSRESRQVQTFSMSMGPWITNPARNDSSPACTTPRSNGGAHSELST
jgi:hypothetical protein